MERRSEHDLLQRANRADGDRELTLHCHDRRFRPLLRLRTCRQLLQDILQLQDIPPSQLYAGLLHRLHQLARSRLILQPQPLHEIAQRLVGQSRLRRHDRLQNQLIAAPVRLHLQERHLPLLQRRLQLRPDMHAPDIDERFLIADELQHHPFDNLTDLQLERLGIACLHIPHQASQHLANLHTHGRPSSVQPHAVPSMYLCIG
ncbi:hypothetical protein [Paenibacillus sp. HJGM_3]|uniref:hypothetical protein n=1 Tax=Paenibacillus sp. HJGM_3 TaxID=3379816 RepID=UPI00385EF205